MDHLILPLTKSSWMDGRIGPIEKQDFFVSIKRAKTLHARHPDSKILVLSNVQVGGCEHEVDCSLRALCMLDVPGGDILVLRKGCETIEQLEIARDIAKKEGAKLVVVSTWLHYLRVRWLARGMGAEHHITYGRPRLREALTDIALIPGMIFIDLLGRREWFKKKVEKRRLSGKH